MKKGLNIEDHRKHGKILKRMYLDSMDLVVACSHAYPKNNRLNNQLRKLHNTIIQVKSEADRELFKDHPSISNAEGFEIYYNVDK
jgi:hypothetical protein